MLFSNKEMNINHQIELFEKLIDISKENKNSKFDSIAGLILAFNCFKNDGSIKSWLEIKSDSYIEALHGELHTLVFKVEEDVKEEKDIDLEYYANTLGKYMEDLTKEMSRFQCNP